MANDSDYGQGSSRIGLHIRRDPDLRASQVESVAASGACARFSLSALGSGAGVAATGAPFGSGWFTRGIHASNQKGLTCQPERVPCTRQQGRNESTPHTVPLRIVARPATVALVYNRLMSWVQVMA